MYRVTEWDSTLSLVNYSDYIPVYVQTYTIEHVLPMSMYKFTQFDRYFLVDSRYIMFYKIK